MKESLTSIPEGRREEHRPEEPVEKLPRREAPRRPQPPPRPQPVAEPPPPPRAPEPPPVATAASGAPININMAGNGYQRPSLLKRVAGGLITTWIIQAVVRLVVGGVPRWILAVMAMILGLFGFKVTAPEHFTDGLHRV